MSLKFSVGCSVWNRLVVETCLFAVMTGSLFFDFRTTVFAQEVQSESKPAENSGSRSEHLSPLVEEKIQASIQRGVDWLVSQQSENGSWQSETYGTLREGIGFSSLIFATLVELGEEVQIPEGVRERSLQFLREHLDEQGLPTATGADTDYPVYAAALLLQGLLEWKPEAHQPAVKQLSQALKKQQRIPENGWPDDDAQRGGWGPGRLTESWSDSLAGTPANTSQTRFVLEALKRAGKLDPQTRQEALMFLSRCQRESDQPDVNGGFFFTPEAKHPLNKSGFTVVSEGDSEKVFLATPYHSATCDGLISLEILGLSVEDQPFSAALKVLPEFPQHELLQPGQPQTKGRSVSPMQMIYFYDSAASGLVWKRLGKKLTNQERWQQQRENRINALLRSQNPNGSWSNPVNWMFEDDPLLSTALAIQALKRWKEEPKLTSQP